MIIDCDSCTMRDIACNDCVVSVLIGGPRQESLLGDEESRVIDLLASRGMVPPLRYAENPNSQERKAARS
jgi:hypothetical protein